ncbi:uncharacterized protein EHS24_003814 [Apiotrichum porosum]|uniref:CN hydrolase domain-containing protein n=1 Tax=Apiotrichum porosum TaxID=105984 RepID=A0A427XEK4_9TREE|nr:uncharacterized protein EHS24_003814 [Apiotrichum porosum]RSH77177.1 hypothetical protein EHS24_003814 [Apiotrichum porosum]
MALPYTPVSENRVIKRDVGGGFYNHLDPESFVVAAVHVSPYPANVNVFSAAANLTWTVERGVEIRRGSAPFPETRFPGYPFALTSNPSEVNYYIEQSLEVGSSECETIITATKEAGIYVSFGASERTNTSIFMAQFLLDPEGTTLIHCHKLRRSDGERNLWSDGKLHDFNVASTPYGRMGVGCWEHFHMALESRVAAHCCSPAVRQNSS